MAKNANKTVATSNEGGLAVIDANIASIQKRGASLKAYVHETLVMIVEHAIKHGDDTRVTKFHRAVKQSLGSSMGSAVVAWLEAYTTFIRVAREPSDEQKTKAREQGGELVFYSIKEKALKEKGLEKAILPLVKAVNSKVRKTTVGGKEAPFVYPAGMSAKELPFYEAERDVPQVPVDFQKSFHDMILRTANEFRKMNQPNYTGKGIVNLDAERLNSLLNSAVSLGFITAEEAGEPVTEPSSKVGQDLAAEAEAAKAREAASNGNTEGVSTKGETTANHDATGKKTDAPAPRRGRGNKAKVENQVAVAA